MFKNAYIAGANAALLQFGLDKDAGIKETLMPLLLAGGIGGGGTAAAAGAHHLMKHPPHMPHFAASAPMSPASSPQLPTFGGALQHELGRLDAAANAR